MTLLLTWSIAIALRRFQMSDYLILYCDSTTWKCYPSVAAMPLTSQKVRVTDGSQKADKADNASHCTNGTGIRRRSRLERIHTFPRNNRIKKTACHNPPRVTSELPPSGSVDEDQTRTKDGSVDSLCRSRVLFDRRDQSNGHAVHRRGLGRRPSRLELDVVVL